jgi:hypothetical protein
MNHRRKQAKSALFLKKMLSKINTLVIIFILILSGCSGKVKNCEFSPDLERIGESALENQKNLSETELRAAKMRCDF